MNILVVTCHTPVYTASVLYPMSIQAVKIVPDKVEKYMMSRDSRWRLYPDRTEDSSLCRVIRIWSGEVSSRSPIPFPSLKEWLKWPGQPSGNCIDVLDGDGSTGLAGTVEGEHEARRGTRSAAISVEDGTDEAKMSTLEWRAAGEEKLQIWQVCWTAQQARLPEQSQSRLNETVSSP